MARNKRRKEGVFSRQDPVSASRWARSIERGFESRPEFTTCGSPHSAQRESSLTTS